MSVEQKYTLKMLIILWDLAARYHHFHLRRQPSTSINQWVYKQITNHRIFRECSIIVWDFDKMVIFLLIKLHNKSLIFYRHIITDRTPLLHGYINRLTNLLSLCLRLRISACLQNLSPVPDHCVIASAT